MMKLNRKQIIAASAFTVLAVGGATIGSLLTEGSDAPTSPSPKASTPTGSVLTGKSGVAGPILAVKIDNVAPARPATNLDKADIVYAIQVEGGLSRLMAVYDGKNLPSTLGPVRSARETDLKLLPQFGHVAFAYSGSSSAIKGRLGSGPWKNVTPGQSGDFYRNPNRYAPHNEYLRTPRQLLNGVPVARDMGFRFGALPAGGARQTNVSASMPAASFQFTWNGSRYRVGMDHGSSPWRTDNVIVQDVSVSTVRHSKSGPVPFSQTVGSGKAKIFRDGRVFNVTWSRPSVNSTTHYKLNNHDFKLKPGKSWVVLK